MRNGHRKIEVSAKAWDRVIEGDLLQGPDGGRLLRAAQVGDADEAVRSGRLSPTGPIYGARMPWPDGAARQLEEAVLSEGLEERALIDRHRQLGEGARRPLRLVPHGVRVSTEGLDATSLQVEFVLPRGAYATTVLEAVSVVDDVSRRGANAREASAIEDEEEGPENER